MATWYFICKIDSKSPHTFGKQLNCSWPPSCFHRWAMLVLSERRLMRFTVAFSDMQFRHGSDAIAEGQTFKSRAQLKTLSFFVVVVVFSVTFLEFQFSKLIRNNPPRLKATFKTNRTKKKIGHWVILAFACLHVSPCNTNLRPQMFCYQVNAGWETLGVRVNTN